MPRQNRVTPFGELIATPERGSLMGNRGCLHDESGCIRRPHVGKRWIYCVLVFKTRRRQVMAPGRYTELFFLDEATALAAGHRPCAECQRERYLDFRRCWMVGQRRRGQALSVDQLDDVLHAERLGPERRRRTYVAPWAELPDGAMVANAEGASLICRNRLLPWTPAGYGPPSEVSPAATLPVLTPPSVVAAIREGFRVRMAG